MNALEMGGDVIIGIVDVVGQYLAQLVYPFFTFGLVGTDQRVHAQHVHRVVVGGIGLGDDPVAEVFVINNVIRANQTGEVKVLEGA